MGPAIAKHEPTMHVGIDFGTTNSAIAVAHPGQPPRLVEFPDHTGAPAPLWRSVLYFEPVAERGDEAVTAGGPAIARYIANEGEGRLLQSIKSHLASSLFRKTQILGRNYTLEALIATFLRVARGAAGVDLGKRAVVGRPVRYWGADSDDDDARALARMRDALTLAGFDDVVFEYEPVAAAARYADRLDHDELVLIADFGGGTSDFSLIRVGPGVPAGDDAILATGGVGIGGDTFDGRLVDRVVSPRLGKGSAYLDEMGHQAPVPAWLYTRLRRWHHLSFLKSRKTLALLDRLQRGALDQEGIDNLVAVVDGDLGLPMHQAIERTKVALSDADDAHFGLRRGDIDIASPVTRDAFDAWIDPELTELAAVVDDVLARAGVSDGDVDRVFATGGSSFVPAIRATLAHRFGIAKLVGGDELTSVAWGLCARARSLAA